MDLSTSHATTFDGHGHVEHLGIDRVMVRSAAGSDVSHGYLFSSCSACFPGSSTRGRRSGSPRWEGRRRGPVLR